MFLNLKRWLGHVVIHRLFLFAVTQIIDYESRQMGLGFSLAERYHFAHVVSKYR